MGEDMDQLRRKFPVENIVCVAAKSALIYFSCWEVDPKNIF